MTYTDVPGGLWLPSPVGLIAVPTIGVSSSMTATTHKCGLVCHAPKAGNIRKIHFRSGTSATAVLMNLRIETVTAATGEPSGSLINAGASATFTPTGTNTFHTVTLGTDATVTRGQLMAIMITGGAVAPSFRWSQMNSGFNGNFPYTAFFASAWSYNVESPILAIEYDDGSIVNPPGVWPISAVNNVAFGSGSTPDEKGFKFRLPFDCKIDAFWMQVDADNDFDVKLIDSDGTTVIETVAWNHNARDVTVAATCRGVFAQERTLTANSWYRLTAVPSTASTISWVDFDVPSAALRAACPNGENFMGTHRTDSGGWTDVDTRFPMGGVRVSSVDIPVGGGGSSEHSFAMVG